MASFACLALLAGTPGAQAKLELDADGLSPRFRSGTEDYSVPATTCGERFELRTRTSGKTRRLLLDPGQAVRVTAPNHDRDHYFVRCLPDGFPELDFDREAEPRSPFYVIAPLGYSDGEPNYAIVLDDRGVPVWWYQDDQDLTDAAVLDDGKIVFSRFYPGRGYGIDPDIRHEVHRLDGSLVDQINTVGTTMDFHDFQQAQDGGYLAVSYKRRTGVNASTFNGDSNAVVYDGVIQKLAPDGSLLWEWNSKDHIGLAETTEWDRLAEPYDLVHLNAVEKVDGGDYLISLNHADAIYRIDGATGDVEWKLGGSRIPASLAVAGDSYGDEPFGGQHDVRILEDGTVTAHDNAYGLDRPPRAVRYRIAGGVATLVDSQADPDVPSSGCCGSARFANGAWAVSWGGTPNVTEFYDGERTFSLALPTGSYSYRAVPVDNQFTRGDLRDGMNDQVALKK